MSTRCCFGIINNETKTVKASRVHCDGYINGGVGYVLQKYYDTPEKIEKLFSLGYISSLGATPEPRPNDMPWRAHDKDHSDHYKYFMENDDYVYRQTSADQDYTWPIEFKNQKEYFEWYKGTDCEYCYLFKNGSWKVWKNGSFQKYTAKSK